MTLLVHHKPWFGGTMKRKAAGSNESLGALKTTKRQRKEGEENNWTAATALEISGLSTPGDWQVLSQSPALGCVVTQLIKTRAAQAQQAQLGTC